MLSSVRIKACELFTDTVRSNKLSKKNFLIKFSSAPIVISYRADISTSKLSHMGSYEDYRNALESIKSVSEIF